MKNILLDLRGQALSVLIMEGASVLFRTALDRFDPADPHHAADALTRIGREAGIPLDKVHLILPGSAVSAATYRMPPMTDADAAKVVHRRLMKEKGAGDPIFRILSLTPEGDKQACLVETADRDALTAIVGFFRDRGITVRTAGSSLAANRKALLASAGDDPGQRLGLIDLGRAHIEFLVLAGPRVLFYDRIAAPAADAEREAGSGGAVDRTEKMRLYRTVEAVYRAYSNYQSACPDLPVGAIGISGTDHSIAGIVDVLKESTGLPVSKLNLIGGAPEDGPAYTALYGLALGLHDGTAANLLPKDLAGGGFVLSRPARVAAVVAAATVLFATAALVESRHQRALALYDARQQEVAARKQSPQQTAAYIRERDRLLRLTQNEAAFYPLLGYLADHTPDGVRIAGVTFTRKTGDPLAELDFAMPPVSDAGARKLLSKLTAMIDRSGMLRRQDEPTLTVVKEAHAVRLHFKVLCEVLP